jgi:hypothetical protein
MKGGRQSAAACMRYPLVSPRKPHSWSGIDGANLRISMPASPMGALRSVLAWTTARLETMFFTHSVHQKVKHVVPNDLFETNLLTEILVYTMDAADARKKIEDANPLLRQSRRN